MTGPYYIEIKKTARYYLLGKPGKNIRNVFFVCHGYGHLAEFFLRKFRVLEDETTLVVAPEGLHRYYLEGSSGRVGASWMTREDRLNDIKDYVRYLDQLADLVMDDCPESSIHILGFSQGCATVSRWINEGKIKADSLILYAGVFPPDVSFDPLPEIFTKTRLLIILGNQDEYISEEKLNEYLEVLRDKGIPFSTFIFEGKHVVEEKALQWIKRSLTGNQ